MGNLDNLGDLTLRYVDTRAKRPRWRLNGAFNLNPRLKAGFEYNLAAGEWTPTANWIALIEKDGLPGLSFGTSSDRIFTPPGYQAYFATLQKSFDGFGAYAGISYSTYEQRLLYPMGISTELAPGWSTLLMLDGRKTHLLVTRSGARASLTVMWVGMRPSGISTSWSF